MSFLRRWWIRWRKKEFRWQRRPRWWTRIRWPWRRTRIRWPRRWTWRKCQRCQEGSHPRFCWQKENVRWFWLDGSRSYSYTLLFPPFTDTIVSEWYHFAERTKYVGINFFNDKKTSLFRIITRAQDIGEITRHVLREFLVRSLFRLSSVDPDMSVPDTYVKDSGCWWPKPSLTLT